MNFSQGTTKLHSALRLTSFLTALSFIFTSTAGAVPFVSSLPTSPEFGASVSISVPPIAIPTELATVEDYGGNFEDNRPTFFYIQDAHGNYDAQNSTKALLDYLKKEEGVTLALIEGASEELNADRLRFFPDDTLNKKLADILAREGELNGLELYLFDSDKSYKALGVEDPSLYAENLKAFRRVLHARSKTESFLTSLRSEIDRLSNHLLNRALRDFTQKHEAYRTGGLELNYFITLLTKYSNEKLSLDLTNPESQIDWPQLFRFSLLSNYKDKIDRKKLISDTEKLEKDLKGWNIPTTIIDQLTNLTSLKPTELFTKQPNTLSPRRIFEDLYIQTLDKGFSFDNYPTLSLFAKQTILQSELEPLSLQEELETLSKKVRGALIEKPSETSVISLLDDLYLLDQAVTLSLDKKGLTQFRQRMNEIEPANLVKRINTVGASFTTPASGAVNRAPTDDGRARRGLIYQTREVASKLDGFLSAVNDFYTGSEKRDEVIVKNALSIMKKYKNNKAVLITGGFHTDSIKELLKTNQASYMLLTPRIHTLDTERENYYKVMMEDASFKTSHIMPQGLTMPSDVLAQIIAQSGGSLDFPGEVALNGFFQLAEADGLTLQQIESFNPRGTFVLNPDRYVRTTIVGSDGSVPSGVRVQYGNVDQVIPLTRFTVTTTGLRATSQQPSASITTVREAPVRREKELAPAGFGIHGLGDEIDSLRKDLRKAKRAASRVKSKIADHVLKLLTEMDNDLGPVTYRVKNLIRAYRFRDAETKLITYRSYAERLKTAQYLSQLDRLIGYLNAAHIATAGFGSGVDRAVDELKTMFSNPETPSQTQIRASVDRLNLVELQELQTRIPRHIVNEDSRETILSVIREALNSKRGVATSRTDSAGSDTVGFGVSLTVRPDIAADYQDLFGSKFVNNRNIDVGTEIVRLTKTLQPRVASVLGARSAMQSDVAAGKVRPETSGYYGFPDLEALVEDVDGKKVTNRDILQGAIDNFFGVDSPNRWVLNAEVPIPNDADSEKHPGLEGTGPADDLGMAMSALNTATSSWMFDSEDAGNDFRDLLFLQWRNLRDILSGRWDNKVFTHPTKIDEKTGKPKTYSVKLVREKWASIFHRIPGIHLRSRQMKLSDGTVVPAFIPMALIHLLNNYGSLTQAGRGVYYYQPKIETPEEALVVAHLLSELESLIGVKRGTIKIKMLNERGRYAANQVPIMWVLKHWLIGPNVGRWDYMNSLIEMFKDDPDMVFPDPHTITMTAPIMTEYTRRNALLTLLVGGQPTGGMSAVMKNPAATPAQNASAVRSMWFDKLRERLTGLINDYDTYRQSWVATTEDEYVRAGEEPLKLAREQLQDLIDGKIGIYLAKAANPEQAEVLKAIGLIDDKGNLKGLSDAERKQLLSLGLIDENGKITPLKLSNEDLTIEKLYSKESWTKLFHKPSGGISEFGLRYAIYMASEYMFQQLNGNNAAAIDDMIEGENGQMKPKGTRLMNDFATYEIFWHWLKTVVQHQKKLTKGGSLSKEGDTVDIKLIKKLLDERRATVAEYFHTHPPVGTAAKFDRSKADLVMDILEKQLLHTRWITYGSRVLLSIVQSDETKELTREQTVSAVFVESREALLEKIARKQLPLEALTVHDYVYDVYPQAKRREEIRAQSAKGTQTTVERDKSRPGHYGSDIPSWAQSDPHTWGYGFGVSLTVRPDIAADYPDLFGSKFVNNRNVDVGTEIVRLTKTLQPRVASVLGARSAMQSDVAAGKVRPETSGYYGFPDLEALVEDVDGKKVTNRGILQGAIDNFFNVASPNRWSLNAEVPIPNDADSEKHPGLEGTGPADDLGMAMSALNTATSSWMFDSEDAGNDFRDLLFLQWRNLRDILSGRWDNKVFTHPTKIDEKTGKPKTYSVKLVREKWASIFHRIPGIHLRSRQMKLSDGTVVPAFIPMTLIHLLNNYGSLTQAGRGVYYYQPKIETPEEALVVAHLLSELESLIGVKRGTIKIKMLNERGRYAANQVPIMWVLKHWLIGPNVGRWDYMNSLIEMFKDDPDMVFPDPHTITMTAPIMTEYTRRNALLTLLVGGQPTGGMSAVMKNKAATPAQNASAVRSMWFDKLRERLTGLINDYDTYRQSWVATTEDEYVRAGEEPLKLAREQLQDLIDGKIGIYLAKAGNPEQAEVLKAIGLIDDQGKLKGLSDAERKQLQTLGLIDENGKITPLKLSNEDLTIEKLYSKESWTKLFHKPSGGISEFGLRYAIYMASEYMFQQLNGNNAAAIDDMIEGENGQMKPKGTRLMNDFATYEIFWHWLKTVVQHKKKLTKGGSLSKEGDVVDTALIKKLLGERRATVAEYFRTHPPVGTAAKFDRSKADLVMDILEKQLLHTRWITYGSRVLLSIVQADETKELTREETVASVFVNSREELLEKIARKQLPLEALTVHDYVYDVYPQVKAVGFGVEANATARALSALATFESTIEDLTQQEYAQNTAGTIRALINNEQAGIPAAITALESVIQKIPSETGVRVPETNAAAVKAAAHTLLAALNAIEEQSSGVARVHGGESGFGFQTLKETREFMAAPRFDRINRLSRLGLGGRTWNAQDISPISSDVEEKWVLQNKMADALFNGIEEKAAQKKYIVTGGVMDGPSAATAAEAGAEALYDSGWQASHHWGKPDLAKYELTMIPSKVEPIYKYLKNKHDDQRVRFEDIKEDLNEIFGELFEAVRTLDATQLEAKKDEFIQRLIRAVKFDIEPGEKPKPRNLSIFINAFRDDTDTFLQALFGEIVKKTINEKAKASHKTREAVRLAAFQALEGMLVNYLIPIYADGDTGHQSIKEMVRLFVKANAAGIHIEDQAHGCKKCGHMAGKVLVSVMEHYRRLTEARKEADKLGSRLVIIGRTDAQAATLLQSTEDSADHFFVKGTTNVDVPALRFILRLVRREAEEATHGLTPKTPEQIVDELAKKFPKLADQIRVIWKMRGEVAGVRYLAQDQFKLRSQTEIVVDAQWIWDHRYAIEFGEDEQLKLETELEDLEGRVITVKELLERRPARLKRESAAVKKLSDIWTEIAEPKTFVNAVAEAILKHRTDTRREQREARWRDLTNPLNHTLSIDQMRALAKAEFGVEIHWDWDKPRTYEGFYQIDKKLGVLNASVRARKFAQIADVVWMEQESPDVAQAAKFVENVNADARAKGVFFALNLSPSFNWSNPEGWRSAFISQAKARSLEGKAAEEFAGTRIKNIQSAMSSKNFKWADTKTWGAFEEDVQAMLDEIMSFSDKMARVGFSFQFVTIFQDHTSSLAMYKAFLALIKYGAGGFVTHVQQPEQEINARFLKHQEGAGTIRDNAEDEAVNRGTSSVSAVSAGTTEAQFGPPVVAGIDFDTMERVRKEISDHVAELIRSGFVVTARKAAYKLRKQAFSLPADGEDVRYGAYDTSIEAHKTQLQEYLNTQLKSFLKPNELAELLNLYVAYIKALARREAYARVSNEQSELGERATKATEARDNLNKFLAASFTAATTAHGVTPRTPLAFLQIDESTEVTLIKRWLDYEDRKQAVRAAQGELQDYLNAVSPADQGRIEIDHLRDREDAALAALREYQDQFNIPPVGSRSSSAGTGFGNQREENVRIEMDFTTSTAPHEEFKFKVIWIKGTETVEGMVAYKFPRGTYQKRGLSTFQFILNGGGDLTLLGGMNGDAPERVKLAVLQALQNAITTAQNGQLLKPFAQSLERKVSGFGIAASPKLAKIKLALPPRLAARLAPISPVITPDGQAILVPSDFSSSFDSGDRLIASVGLPLELTDRAVDITLEDTVVRTLMEIYGVTRNLAEDELFQAEALTPSVVSTQIEKYSAENRTAVSKTGPVALAIDLNTLSPDLLLAKEEISGFPDGSLIIPIGTATEPYQWEYLKLLSARTKPTSGRGVIHVEHVEDISSGPKLDISRAIPQVNRIVSKYGISLANTGFLFADFQSLVTDGSKDRKTALKEFGMAVEFNGSKYRKLAGSPAKVREAVIELLTVNPEQRRVVALRTFIQPTPAGYYTFVAELFTQLYHAQMAERLTSAAA